MQGLDARRLARAGGIWLAAVYALCVVYDLLVGAGLAMYRVWGPLFPGFNGANPWTWLLGLAEAFAYGWVGAWAFAALYNRLRPSAQTG